MLVYTLLGLLWSAYSKPKVKAVCLSQHLQTGGNGPTPTTCEKTNQGIIKSIQRNYGMHLYGITYLCDWKLILLRALRNKQQKVTRAAKTCTTYNNGYVRNQLRPDLTRRETPHHLSSVDVYLITLWADLGLIESDDQPKPVLPAGTLHVR